MYSNETPSAPAENIEFIPSPNLYPKIVYPEFNANDYRINRIMNQYKFLEDEMKARGNLRKKYCKASKTLLGTEFLVTLSELGMVGTSLALPVIIPFSVPISAGLTTISTILRTSSNFITGKINKHSEIELLAKSKLNSIEEKFTKAIKDGKISDEEFNDIEQEIKNYSNMKTTILSDRNKKQQKNVTDDLKLKLLEKGKDIGRNEVWESFKIRV